MSPTISLPRLNKAFCSSRIIHGKKCKQQYIYIFFSDQAPPLTRNRCCLCSAINIFMETQRSSKQTSINLVSPQIPTIHTQVAWVCAATFWWTSICFKVGKYGQSRAAQHPHPPQVRGPGASGAWSCIPQEFQFLGSCFWSLGMAYLGCPVFRGMLWESSFWGLPSCISCCCALTRSMHLQVGKPGIYPLAEACHTSDSSNSCLCKWGNTGS